MTEQDANRQTAEYNNLNAMADSAEQSGNAEQAHNFRVEANNLASEAYSEAGGEVGEDRS
jgi:hypothetical protein